MCYNSEHEQYFPSII